MKTGDLVKDEHYGVGIVIEDWKEDTTHLNWRVYFMQDSTLLHVCETTKCFIEVLSESR